MNKPFKLEEVDDDEFVEPCPICNRTVLQADYCAQKTCDLCNRDVCIDCVALTGCQCREGVCVHYYDYKCQDCQVNFLDRGILYLLDSEPNPLCKDCRMKPTRHVNHAKLDSVKFNVTDERNVNITVRPLSFNVMRMSSGAFVDPSKINGW